MHQGLPAVRWVGGVELELIAIATGRVAASAVLRRLQMPAVFKEP